MVIDLVTVKWTNKIIYRGLELSKNIRRSKDFSRSCIGAAPNNIL